MKNCGVSSEALAEYIFGEMEPSEASRIAGHIKECSACREEIKKLSAVSEAVKSIEVDFSGDIWDMQRASIIRKLEKKEKQNVSIFRVFSPGFMLKTAGAAALIFILAAAGFKAFDYIKTVESRQAIAGNTEMLQNLEILERLDFYEKISAGKKQES